MMDHKIAQKGCDRDRPSDKKCTKMAQLYFKLGHFEITYLCHGLFAPFWCPSRLSYPNMTLPLTNMGRINLNWGFFQLVRVNDQELSILAVPLYECLNELSAIGSTETEISCLMSQLQLIGQQLEVIIKYLVEPVHESCCMSHWQYNNSILEIFVWKNERIIYINKKLFFGKEYNTTCEKDFAWNDWR